MVRRLLVQQPQHRFAVKPAQRNQLVHQGTLLPVAQGWEKAAGSLQKLLAPLTLGPAISRCRALHKRNIPNESTMILGVTELTSQRGLAGRLVDIGSLLANCLGGTAVTLVRRDEFDAAVAVLVVVPIHKGPHPLARRLIAGRGGALARSFSSSFCSAIECTGFALESWAACRQRLTCSGNSPRSLQ